MIKSALIVLGLSCLATCEPPIIAGYQGSSHGVIGVTGGLEHGQSNVVYPAHPGGSGQVTHISHGVPSAYAGGGGKPVSSSGIFENFRRGVLHGIGNGVFGRGGAKHQGYRAPANSIVPHGAVKLIPGKVVPQFGNRPRPGHKLPVPSGHDNNPWRPIKSGPVQVVLNRPIHDVQPQPQVQIQQQQVQPAVVYGAHSQNHLSILPSMSYGYSYKLVPTYAYGPTLSAGPGSGLGGVYGG